MEWTYTPACNVWNVNINNEFILCNITNRPYFAKYKTSDTKYSSQTKPEATAAEW